jgi:8-oxo-dGTP pyrophosphatase MutT (NUDIX family)
MIPEASPSAVAIIETPDSFVLEGRPDIPGQLAYAGKLQLFGGHCEEEPHETIRRELAEELAYFPTEDPRLLWTGEVDSRNREGDAVKRHVSLFHVAIGSAAELKLQVPGKIVEIPKTEHAIELHKEQLTPFACTALTKAVRGGYQL